MKQAFTMVELIFVIVILAILSMFGADLYTKIYQSYVHARAINQLEDRTQNALNIIYSKLEDRIQGSVIGRNHAIAYNKNIVPITEVEGTDNVLEWIPQSVESRYVIGEAKTGIGSFGWSGYTTNQYFGKPNFTVDGASLYVVTPGSKINDAAAIIKKLRATCKTKACKNAADSDFAVLFRLEDPFVGLSEANTYYGYNGKTDRENRSAIYTAEVSDKTVNKSGTLTAGSPNDMFKITDGFDSTISTVADRYYLAHTAYAIVPTNAAGDIVTSKDIGLTIQGVAVENFNLTLKYNYRPWKGEKYTDTGAGKTIKSALLAEDVSVFRFKQDDANLRLQICLRDNGRNFDPEKLDLIICKNQVVF